MNLQQSTKGLLEIAVYWIVLVSSVPLLWGFGWVSFSLLCLVLGKIYWSSSLKMIYLSLQAPVHICLIWRYEKNRDHIIINQRWRWMLMRWWFIYLFYSCKCRTWTKILKRNFSLTANWPLNQLFLLRYANDREAERWLKLPFNSTLHCLTLDKKNWLQMKESCRNVQSPHQSISHPYCVHLWDVGFISLNLHLKHRITFALHSFLPVIVGDVNIMYFKTQQISCTFK